MGTLSSSPPPSPAGPPGIPARHESLLELETAKSWKRRRAQVDYLKLSPHGLELHHGGFLRKPLQMPLGAIAVAAAEPGMARAAAVEGRFPILRRLSATAIVPQTEGVEGWLWTSSGGSALPSLTEDDEAPNVALILTHPLGEDIVRRSFSEDFVTALAVRSALGTPVVYGLLLRVTDSMKAENAFRRFTLLKPLTDREVAPTLRRSLPLDRSPNPTVQLSDAHRSGSVAPPGLG